jgi:hypothetical protein
MVGFECEPKTPNSPSYITTFFLVILLANTIVLSIFYVAILSLSHLIQVIATFVLLFSPPFQLLCLHWSSIAQHFSSSTNCHHTLIVVNFLERGEGSK